MDASNPESSKKRNCLKEQTGNLSDLQMVGLTGLEPVTPALSRQCSNQLSYRPFTQITEMSQGAKKELLD